MLNQWEPKIAEGLTNSGLPVAAGDGIAKALTGVLAGGVGYAAGGMAGAARVRHFSPIFTRFQGV